MGKILKTNMLDDCVDGSIDKLSELVGDNYDQFNTFVSICNKLAIGDTIYSLVNFSKTETTVSFQLTWDIDNNLLEEVKKDLDNSTSIELTDSGIIINISVKRR